MADGATFDDDLRAIEMALSTIVRQAKSKRQHERIAELGAVSLEASMYPVLRHVDATGSPRLTELAEVLNVDVSTISRQVRQLEELGLLRRDGDPGDGRAVVLSLTSPGRQVLDEFGQARRRRIAELVEDWSDTDRRALAQLLSRLAESIVESADSPVGIRR